MMLVKLQDDLKKGNMMQSHTSGFSIGDSELDKIKLQNMNIQKTYTEEKKISDQVFKEQNEQIEKTQKELEEANEIESKQKLRMKELQDELQQTIKRIEQLQRGVGG